MWHVRSCGRCGKKLDNNILSPEKVVSMMTAAAGVPLRLVHAHRLAIHLAEPELPKMHRGQELANRSLLRWVGDVFGARTHPACQSVCACVCNVLSGLPASPPKGLLFLRKHQGHVLFVELFMCWQLCSQSDVRLLHRNEVHTHQLETGSRGICSIHTVIDCQLSIASQAMHQ